jgi:hypothetical protein
MLKPRFFGLLAAMLLSAGVSLAADPPLVTFDAGLNQTLVQNGKNEQTARIPLSVREQTKVKFQLRDAVFKDGHSGDLFKAFDIKYDEATADRGAALLVTAKGDKIWPGAYVLLLKAMAEAQVAGKKDVSEQAFSINLQVSSPQVTGSTKVVVSQTKTVFGEDEPFPGKLVINEQSQKIAAFGLMPTETHDPPPHGEYNAATLEFAPASAPLASFETPASFSVSPKGSFPLGQTTGRIEVRSPSLSTALTVPYEVWVRRPLWVLFVLAALGTLAGWFLRTKITADQDLLTARAAIATAIRAGLRAKKGRDDATFNAAVDLALQDLNDAQEWQDPKLMLVAAKKAEGDIQNLCTVFDARIPPLIAQVNDLQKLTTLNWRLPDPLTKQVEGLRKEILSIADLIKQKNLEAVEAALKAAQDTYVPLLGRSIQDFIGSLADYLAAVAASPFPLPPPGTSLLKQATDEASKAKASFQTPGMSYSRIDGVSATLLSADWVYHLTSTFAGQAVDFTTSICKTAESTLKQTFADLNDDFSPVTELSEAYATRFAGRGVSDPAAELAMADNDAIRRKWRALLMQLSPKAPVDKIDAALDAARWMDAVDVAVAAAATTSTAAGATFLATAMRQDITSQTDGSTTVQPLTKPDSTARVNIQPPTSIEDANHQLQELAAQSHLLAGLQSVSFGFIFIVGAYLLYSDSWVGTGKEIIAIFTLAFTVDLSSDGIIAALKKVT